RHWRRPPYVVAMMSVRGCVRRWRRYRGGPRRRRQARSPPFRLVRVYPRGHSPARYSSHAWQRRFWAPRAVSYHVGRPRCGGRGSTLRPREQAPEPEGGDSGGSAEGMAMDVVVYTTPTCPYCQMAKEYLTQRGVTFTERDV